MTWKVVRYFDSTLITKIESQTKVLLDQLEKSFSSTCVVLRAIAVASIFDLVNTKILLSTTPLS